MNLDFTQIAPMIPYCITGTSCGLALVTTYDIIYSKLSLKRDINSPKNLELKRLPESVIHNNKGRLYTIGIKKYYIKCMNEFIDEAKKNFPYANLGIFRENTKNLTFIKCKQKTSGRFIAYAYFCLTRDGEHMMYYNDSEYIKEFIWHEFIHMTNSKYYNGVFYIGFNYICDNINIGAGINEGYTELLTHRHFQNKGLTILSYPILVVIANILEKYFIGKDSMERMYFEMDLPSLIETLEKYDTKDNVVSFIRKMDILLKIYQSSNMSHIDKKKHYIVLKDIIETLSRWHRVKIEKEIGDAKDKKESLIKEYLMSDFAASDELEYLYSELKDGKRHIL